MTFWDSHGDEISAAITIVVALICAKGLDRLIVRWMSGGYDPGLETRLRLVRRLVFVTVIVFGVALALAQFDSIKRVATAVLASSAVLGLVVGFAARQTLANAVAGILLAVTQPLRIGDYIRFQDTTGVVDDMTLSYTFIDTLDGSRTVVPNEQLVSGILHNRNLADREGTITVSAWLPRGVDFDAVRRALAPIEPDEIHLAELTDSGMRIEVRSGAGPGATGRRREGELREQLLARLSQAGLMDPAGG